MLRRMTMKTQLGPRTLLYPMPAVLVGVLVHNKPNFMTAAWCGIACSEPPMLSVAIRKPRYTREGITENGRFSINVPRSNHAAWVDYLGIASGRDEDKNANAGIDVFYDEPEHTPMIVQCPVSLVCRVAHILALGTHDLVIGEILQTHIDEDCVVNGTPDVNKIDPLVYEAGGRTYHSMGPTVGKGFNAGLSLRGKKQP